MVKSCYHASEQSENRMNEAQSAQMKLQNWSALIQYICNMMVLLAALNHPTLH